jgi:hypothetical protein
MRSAVSAVCLITFFALAGPSLSAQWPRRMPPDVPKNPAGQVDLNAPAPKTADGKPDLSGLWRGAPFAGPGGRRGGGAGAAPATPPPVPPPGPPAANFLDIAQNVTGGLPLTPYGQELLETRVAGNSKDNPEAHCLPMGIVQLHTQGAPRRFIQSPRQLVILYEASMERREIFTDGREVPPMGEPQPFWNGYSAGRWEGDTLVVETTNLTDKTSIGANGNGSRHSDRMKLTEWFTRVDPQMVEYKVRVEDPVAYTAPFTLRMMFTSQPDYEVYEYSCHEGNGAVGYALSADRAYDRAVAEAKAKGLPIPERTMASPYGPPVEGLEIIDLNTGARTPTSGRGGAGRGGAGGPGGAPGGRGGQ